MTDDLDRAISDIRSKPDHSELWAELDRDNALRREYRANGLEPPTTWDTKEAPVPAGPEGVLAKVHRKYRTFCAAVERTIEAVFKVIGLVLATAFIVAIGWWLLSPIFANESYRMVLVAAIIGGLVVKYVL